MNVLIIGLGSIAKKHIISLNTLFKDVNIFAIRYEQKVVEVKGVKNIYSYNQIPKNIDFAIISNPTYKHLEAITNLINLKIPLFIEKPAVHTFDEVNTLNNILKHNPDVFTYVACNLRFHPCLQYLKNYLNSNEDRINEVNIYCGSYLPSWRENTDFKSIYSANKEMGGGVHLDLFHEFDYAVWLFGSPDNVTAFRSNNSSLEIDAIDYANYLFIYPGYAVNIILNYYRPVPKRHIEIIFENDIILLDLIKHEVKDKNNSVLFQSVNFQMQDTYTEQLLYFYNKLRAKEKPMNNLSESLKILKLCLQDE